MRRRIFRIIQGCFTILLSFVFLFSSYNFFRSDKVYATNVLTNPSFTTNANGWTLSVATYSSTIYQDSAGSVSTQTVAGRKKTAIGTATQTTPSIPAGSTVYLTLYWSKQCVTLQCTTNTIEARIGGTTVWSETTNPAAGARTAWASSTTINVSSYFTTTQTYSFEIYFNQRNGNNKNAQSLAWVDNVNLDVIPPNITVGTTGTQASTLQQGESNAYIGGAFTLIRDLASTSVTSITISKGGTISDSNISGLIIYYKQEATCSTTIPGDATQFNSTPGSFSSGSSTVTGTMTVGTSRICAYIEVDIGAGAGVGDTVEIQITNPSTQVTASNGTVSPATAVAISGTTTITSAGALSVDIVDGSDQSVVSPSVSFSSTFFSWVGEQTTGTLGTSTQKIKVTNGTSTHTWTLSIAATSGESSLWQDASKSYDYNGTQSAGRLRVNPSSVTITPGGACSNTGISGQSAQYFASGSVSSINLVIASASAEHDCYWYITGVGLTQDIPAEQQIGTYSLGMTITVI